MLKWYKSETPLPRHRYCKASATAYVRVQEEYLIFFGVNCPFLERNLFV